MGQEQNLPPSGRSFRHDGLFWRRFAYLGCVYGPEWFKRYSPPFFAAAIFALVGQNRRGAVANAARVTNSRGLGARLAALQMFAEFSRCFAETMEFYSPRPHPIRVDVPDVDPLAEALDRGRGAVVVTGHFGNWDVAAKTLHQYERPVNAVMAREANETTHEYVRQARERAGVRVIYSDTSAFSSFNMLRALRRNEIVAMQLDRSLGLGGTRQVPFFDAPAAFSAGPFVLARLAQAPLIPVFIPRLGRRHYAIRLGGSFSVSKDARGSGLDRVMSAVVQRFEEVVREFPTQWFQFAPFWPAAVSQPAVPLDDDDRIEAGARG